MLSAAAAARDAALHVTGRAGWRRKADALLIVVAGGRSRRGGAGRCPALARTHVGAAWERACNRTVNVPGQCPVLARLWPAARASRRRVISFLGGMMEI